MLGDTAVGKGLLCVARAKTVYGQLLGPETRRGHWARRP